MNHFYLIDNNSTDGYEEILRPYSEKGLVTLFIEDGGREKTGSQADIYNRVLMQIRYETQWLAIVDLDEFIYAREGTTAGFISELSKSCNVNVLSLPVICFGSSGHIEQPSSVIQGFQKRKEYKTPGQVIIKSIIKPMFLIYIHVHKHEIGGWRALDATLSPVKYTEWLTVDENFISNSKLVLNHYAVQSRDRFFKNKLSRNDSNISPNGNGRILSPEDFFKNDHNDVVDNTLAMKRRGRARDA